MAEKTTREQAKAIIEKVIQTAKSAESAQMKGMIGLGAYIRQTIRRQFRKGNVNQKKQGRPLKLYTPRGREICDMETWLKDAYVASGNGSFKKEKVQARGKIQGGGTTKGSAPPGTYRLDHERPGEFFDKGTGKFSEAERQNIQDVKKAEKGKRQLTRQIRALQRERNRQLKIAGRSKMGMKRRNRAEEQARILREQQRQLAAKRRELMSVKRDHRFRIVAPNKHFVPAKNVKAFAEYKNRSKPGQPPKSWANNFLRKNIFFEATEKGITIFMNPSSYGDQILSHLEEGGSSIKKRVFRIGEGNYKEVGDLLGYTVESVYNKGSHRRFRLKRRYSKDIPTISFAPRPFWRPAQEKLKDKVPEVFGEVHKTLSQLTFGR